MNKLFILLINVLYCISLLAEDIKEIPSKGVIGKYQYTSETSREIARKKAQEKAKLQALIDAGIEEDISSTKSSISYESNTSGYFDFFSSHVETFIKGAIKNPQFYEEKVVEKSDELSEISIKLDCTVLKYNTVPDSSFTVEISGLKKNYSNGEGLEFAINPVKDVYLSAFLINGERGFQIFPNSKEKSKKFEADREYSFPLNKNIKYTLKLNDKDKNENHLLVLVFLKTDTKKFINKKIDPEVILDWYSGISPDQKYIIYKDFRVIE